MSVELSNTSNRNNDDDGDDYDDNNMVTSVKYLSGPA